jgi:kynurenine formamidase
LPRVDLSHPITEGMVTYPGLPAPTIATHLSRDDAEERYAPGIRFHIGVVTLCTNTGTYLDVPFHRYDDGYDLADLSLDRVADVPALVLDRRGVRTIELTAADLADAAGHAVLIRTDHGDHWGTPRYVDDHPHLSASAAQALVDADVACVGIDTLNIDATADVDGAPVGQRPVHSTLLAAGIPIVEHLTALRDVPERGARFTAVPPPIVGVGTFTVRAYASC